LLGRSLSANARMAALFISLIRHVHEWACGERAVWFRNHKTWTQLNAADMAPTIVRLASAAFAVLNGLCNLDQDQRMRALASAAAFAFSGTDANIPKSQYMQLAVRYGLLTDQSERVLKNSSRAAGYRLIEIESTDYAAKPPVDKARYLFSAASAALFATGFGHSPHPRHDTGGFYLEHALRDALQLYVTAALTWRCDANKTPDAPTTLGDFAKPLFRLLSDILKDLPDTKPTREVATLTAAHAFQPIQRVESETENTTVAAADAYLRALKQIAEHDTSFLNAFGRLPETAAALTGLATQERERVSKICCGRKARSSLY